MYVQELLRDQEGEGIVLAKIESSELGIELSFDGYGDCASSDNHGTPVFIEFYEGKLWLRVWADINQEDPTHCIDLSGALVSNRRENENQLGKRPRTYSFNSEKGFEESH